MTQTLKHGGIKPSGSASRALQSLKAATSFEPRMLTPSEVSWLKQDFRHSIQELKTIKVKAK